MKKLLLISFVLLFCIAPFVDAGTYYVDPAGSDSNDGSIDYPWQTLMKAVQSTGPGDTVLLREGTHIPGGEFWVREELGQGGSVGNKWTLKAYPGEEAIIQNRIILDASYCRIEGIHWVATGGIIQLADGGPSQGIHNEVVNNLLTGAYTNYSGAINVVGTDCLVENNTLNLTPSGTQTHGIYVMAGKSGAFSNSNTIVRGNTVINASYYGIHAYDEQKGGNPQRVISNLIIENNIVHDSQSRSGILLACGADTTIQGAIVRNNIVYDTGGSWPGIGVFYAGDGINNVKIYNNIIYNPGGEGIRIGTGNITNISIVNNIIDMQSSDTHINNQEVEPTNTANNNIYWPSPARLTNISDANAIVDNPDFTNPTASFYPLVGSPSINSGVTLTDVLTDIDGVSRPQNGDYDVGAYEFVSGVICSDYDGNYSGCIGAGCYWRSSTQTCSDTEVTQCIIW